MHDDNQTMGTAPSMSQPTVPSSDGSAGSAMGVSDSDTPASSPATVVSPTDSYTPPTLPSHVTSSDSGDLQGIKEKALKDLTPLLSDLDQTPEEKYKTLMMIIQASDDQKLLAEAYQTAQKITDTKLRADALVGIINEINYFTSK